jgi:two-component system sensor histidine kinase TctE
MHMLINSQRRFIADASHQLRTPLTVLKTQAELALRECDTPIRRAAARIVRSMAATTDSTVNLANRLLTLARIEHRGDDSTAPVSLREIARQVGLELAPAAVASNIDLSLEAEQQEWCRPGLAAARNAGQPGRQRAALHAGRRRRHPARAEDAGRGHAGSRRHRPRHPAAERERVFAPFYRAAATLERNPAATAWGWPSCATSPPCTAPPSPDEGDGGQGLKDRLSRAVK